MRYKDDCEEHCESAPVPVAGFAPYDTNKKNCLEVSDFTKTLYHSSDYFLLRVFIDLIDFALN